MYAPQTGNKDIQRKQVLEMQNKNSSDKMFIIRDFSSQVFSYTVCYEDLLHHHGERTVKRGRRILRTFTTEIFGKLSVHGFEK
jgi:hypothetical protein